MVGTIFHAPAPPGKRTPGEFIDQAMDPIIMLHARMSRPIAIVVESGCF